MSLKKTLALGTLMLLLASSLLIPSMSAGDPTQLYVNDLVVIDASHGAPKLPRGVEIEAVAPDHVDVILPHILESELDQAGITYTIQIHDVDSYMNQYRGNYHTLQQIQDIVNATAANYPDITQLTTIGTTYQGRQMYCLEISDNPGVDEGEPNVLFMAVHHAREWPGVEIVLHMIDLLTSQYATNATIQSYVNNNRIFIIPLVNPDGYYRSHDQGYDWRKNMHYFPQWGTTGVDLNRNYAGSCNGVGLGEWGTSYQGSCSHGSGDEVFCGPDANSELEVQAVENFVKTHDITASISWHTFEELVLYPWGYTTAHTPDNTLLSQIGTTMANMIAAESGGGHYTPEQSDSLYPTNGDYLDWSYGYGYWELGRINFCYTIEAGQQFQPPASHLDQICTENCQAGLYLLSQAQNLSQVVPLVIHPTIADIPNSTTGHYTVSWQVPNPNSNPDSYELDELTGLSLVTDDAENGMTNWVTDGFTVSTQRAHSGTQSFKGHTADGQASTITTKDPVPISSGMSASFWTYYDTENQYDFGYFEVSQDGRYFNIIANFTGSGTSWQEHTYDLSQFAGQSVFLRFRYITDDYTHGEGFYVDDVTPVSLFAQNTTISNTLTQPNYEFQGKLIGTYYYKVRGHNQERGWGDFSTIKTVFVTQTQNDTTPPTLNITKPLPKYLYIKNNDGRAFFTSLILGPITVTANSTDDFGVAVVQFYLDGVLVSNDTQAPYTWDWNTHSFGKHTIKVVSTDTSGNQATQELVVRKFF